MTKYTDPRPTAVMDTECYPNYWSIAFRDIATKRVVRLRRTPTEELDRHRLAKIMRNWRIVSFNGIGYDMPMIALAMTGATNAALKNASDELIFTDIPYWQFMRNRDLELPDFIDHIDLKEVSPGSAQKDGGDNRWGPSLKLYAGRMHSKRMQDLPFPVDTVLTDEQIELLENYHDNDLAVTEDLYVELKPQIELRAKMSDQYGVDLRSKSDAQVAEAVIKTEIERITGNKVYKPDIKPGVFKYVAPPFIKFQTPEMQALLKRITSSNMVVKENGRIQMPEWLEKAEIPLGESLYSMGIGGLHSNESSVAHISDDTVIHLDRDVRSYYPSIILLLKLFPKHLGPVFLKVYKRIFDTRISAKERAEALEQAADMIAARGYADIAETLKIVLNGSFGKFGSPYSVLSSPALMIQTTVTGQLGALMCIESLVLRGFNVVSANTDGFVTRVPRNRRDEFNAVLFDWELDTGFITEETAYRALYSRDVNNYIAITEKGKVKGKGAFAPAGPGQKGAAGLKKNPACEVTIDAVIAFLKDGTPLEETVRYCDDVRKFVTIQRVTGGATKDGEYLGKAIRWYYSTDTQTAIHRAQNGNLVPSSMGAMPCMELPDELPEDIDFDWYEREAVAILQDIGIEVIDPALAGRTGMFTGLLGDQKTYHSVRLPSGVAVCGKKPKSIRETWKETKSIAPGYRLCSKCVKGGDI